MLVIIINIIIFLDFTCSFNLVKLLINSVLISIYNKETKLKFRLLAIEFSYQTKQSLLRGYYYNKITALYSQNK